MDVKTLCLGELTEGDQTGYEIKQRFEEPFRHFFVAGYGSIYPALAELTRQDMVHCTNIEQEKRPDKKVYGITERGRRFLIEELLATPPRHKVRSEFLVLVYFAHLLPPSAVGRIIERMVAEWQEVLGHIEGCVLSGDDGEGPCLTEGARFTAGFGQAVLSAARDYVERHKQELVDGLAAAMAGRAEAADDWKEESGAAQAATAGT
jgi:DNA-binding PadR family transcriptional regulator